MKAEDMETVAELIVESLHVSEGSEQHRALAGRVKDFASQFAVPGIDW